MLHPNDLKSACLTKTSHNIKEPLRYFCEAIREHRWKDATILLPIIVLIYPFKIPSNFIWKALNLILSYRKVPLDLQLKIVSSMFKSSRKSEAALEWISKHFASVQMEDWERISEVVRKDFTQSIRDPTCAILFSAYYSLRHYLHWKQAYILALEERSINKESSKKNIDINCWKLGRSTYLLLKDAISRMQFKETCGFLLGPMIDVEKFLQTERYSMAEIEYRGLEFIQKYASTNDKHLPGLKILYLYLCSNHPEESSLIEGVLEKAVSLCPATSLVFNYVDLLMENDSDSEMSCPGNSEEGKQCVLQGHNISTLIKCLELLCHLVEFEMWKESKRAWDIITSILQKFYSSWVRCWNCESCEAGREQLEEFSKKLFLWPELFWNEFSRCDRHILVQRAFSSVVFGYGPSFVQKCTSALEMGDCHDDLKYLALLLQNPSSHTSDLKVYFSKKRRKRFLSTFSSEDSRNLKGTVEGLRIIWPPMFRVVKKLLKFEYDDEETPFHFPPYIINSRVEPLEKESFSENLADTSSSNDFSQSSSNHEKNETSSLQSDFRASLKEKDIKKVITKRKRHLLEETPYVETSPNINNKCEEPKSILKDPKLIKSQETPGVEFGKKSPPLKKAALSFNNEKTSYVETSPNINDKCEQPKSIINKDPKLIQFQRTPKIEFKSRSTPWRKAALSYDHEKTSYVETSSNINDECEQPKSIVNKDSKLIESQETPQDKFGKKSLSLKKAALSFNPEKTSYVETSTDINDKCEQPKSILKKDLKLIESQETPQVIFGKKSPPLIKAALSFNHEKTSYIVTSSNINDKCGQPKSIVNKDPKLIQFQKNLKIKFKWKTTPWRKAALSFNQEETSNNKTSPNINDVCEQPKSNLNKDHKLIESQESPQVILGKKSHPLKKTSYVETTLNINDKYEQPKSNLNKDSKLIQSQETPQVKFWKRSSFLKKADLSFNHEKTPCTETLTYINDKSEQPKSILNKDLKFIQSQETTRVEFGKKSTPSKKADLSFNQEKTSYVETSPNIIEKCEHPKIILNKDSKLIQSQETTRVEFGKKSPLEKASLSFNHEITSYVETSSNIDECEQPKSILNKDHKLIESKETPQDKFGKESSPSKKAALSFDHEKTSYVETSPNIESQNILNKDHKLVESKETPQLKFGNKSFPSKKAGLSFNHEKTSYVETSPNINDECEQPKSILNKDSKLIKSKEFPQVKFGKESSPSKKAALSFNNEKTSYVETSPYINDEGEQPKSILNKDPKLIKSKEFSQVKFGKESSSSKNAALSFDQEKTSYVETSPNINDEGEQPKSILNTDPKLIKSKENPQVKFGKKSSPSKKSAISFDQEKTSYVETSPYINDKCEQPKSILNKDHKLIESKEIPQIKLGKESSPPKKAALSFENEKTSYVENSPNVIDEGEQPKSILNTDPKLIKSKESPQVKLGKKSSPSKNAALSFDHEKTSYDETSPNINDECEQPKSILNTDPKLIKSKESSQVKFGKKSDPSKKAALSLDQEKTSYDETSPNINDEYEQPKSILNKDSKLIKSKEFPQVKFGKESSPSKKAALSFEHEKTSYVETSPNINDECEQPKSILNTDSKLIKSKEFSQVKFRKESSSSKKAALSFEHEKTSYVETSPNINDECDQPKSILNTDSKLIKSKEFSQVKFRKESSSSKNAALSFDQEKTSYVETSPYINDEGEQPKSILNTDSKLIKSKEIPQVKFGKKSSPSKEAALSFEHEKTSYVETSPNINHKCEQPKSILNKDHKLVESTETPQLKFGKKSSSSKTAGLSFNHEKTSYVETSPNINDKCEQPKSILNKDHKLVESKETRQLKFGKKSSPSKEAALSFNNEKTLYVETSPNINDEGVQPQSILTMDHKLIKCKEVLQFKFGKKSDSSKKAAISFDQEKTSCVETSPNINDKCEQPKSILNKDHKLIESKKIPQVKLGKKSSPSKNAALSFNNEKTSYVETSPNVNDEGEQPKSILNKDHKLIESKEPPQVKLGKKSSPSKNAALSFDHEKTSYDETSPNINDECEQPKSILNKDSKLNKSKEFPQIQFGKESSSSKNAALFFDQEKTSYVETSPNINDECEQPKCILNKDSKLIKSKETPQVKFGKKSPSKKAALSFDQEKTSYVETSPNINDECEQPKSILNKDSKFNKSKEFPQGKFGKKSSTSKKAALSFNNENTSYVQTSPPNINDKCEQPKSILNKDPKSIKSQKNPKIKFKKRSTPWKITPLAYDQENSDKETVYTEPPFNMNVECKQPKYLKNPKLLQSHETPQVKIGKKSSPFIKADLSFKHEKTYVKTSPSINDKCEQPKSILNKDPKSIKFQKPPKIKFKKRSTPWKITPLAYDQENSHKETVYTEPSFNMNVECKQPKCLKDPKFVESRETPKIKFGKRSSPLKKAALSFDHEETTYAETASNIDGKCLGHIPPKVLFGRRSFVSKTASLSSDQQTSYSSPHDTPRKNTFSSRTDKSNEASFSNSQPSSWETFSDKHSVRERRNSKPIVFGKRSLSEAEQKVLIFSNQPSPNKMPRKRTSDSQSFGELQWQPPKKKFGRKS